MEEDEEVEAVARALANDALEDADVMWRSWERQAEAAIAALDRVRSRPVSGTDGGTEGEDHEAGKWVQPEAFCEQPRCQAKNDGYCHVPESCGHFQPKQRWMPAPSPVSGTEPEAEVWRSMLGRIRVHGASGLWTGEDCAIGAAAALEGEDAGRAFMLEREAARGEVSGTEPDTAKLVEALREIAHYEHATAAGQDLVQYMVKVAREALDERAQRAKRAAGLSVDAGKPEHAA